MEKIVHIVEYHGAPKGRWSKEAGYQIITDEQIITLAIDDEASCCESWGYFLTEDDTSKFIGAELRGVTITDTNRSTRRFKTYESGAPYADNYGTPENPIENLDAGEAMFVDIETSVGTLQFVAYNAHNGYYGHEARVISRQLEHAVTL